MVVCLQRGADLNTAKLMPLTLTVSCFSKIQIGFTFLVPAHPGSPGQRAVKQVCVCVYPGYFPEIFWLGWICRQSALDLIRDSAEFQACGVALLQRRPLGVFIALSVCLFELQQNIYCCLQNKPFGLRRFHDSKFASRHFS